MCAIKAYNIMKKDFDTSEVQTMQKDPKQQTGGARRKPQQTAGAKNTAPKTHSTAKPGLKKTAQGGAKPNMINVRRTLRMSGRTTINVTQKMMTWFERYVELEDTGERAKKKSKIRISFSTFIICAVALLLFALLLFSNRNIVTDQQKVTIVGVSEDFEGYSILHLSDLHGRRYGENQSSLLRAISELDYDIVLITGDMVGASGDPKPFYELLEGLKLEGSEPVYFIAGDSDPGPLLSSARDIVGTLNEMVLEDWILGAMERGAIYLNKPLSLEVGSSTLWLSPAAMLNINADDALEMSAYELDLQKDGVIDGIGADYTELPFTNYRYRQISGLKEGALYLEEEDLHITLSHYPPAEDVLASSLTAAYTVENAYLFAPDLAFCGHYCGGIWRLPGLGAFYIPDALADRHGWLPDQDVATGLRQGASTMIYTSAGLGVTDYGFFPDFRLMNSPQISLITLTTKLTEDLLAN